MEPHDKDLLRIKKIIVEISTFSKKLCVNAPKNVVELRTPSFLSHLTKRNTNVQVIVNTGGHTVVEIRP